MSIDLCACRRMVENEGVAEGRRFGISEELFISDGEKVFKFIAEHTKKHGQEPTIPTILTNTGVDIDIPAPEPLSYYAEKLFERKVLGITQEHAKTMVGHIQGKKATDAVDEARAIISETLKWRFGKKNYVDPRLTIDARVRAQVELENLHGMIDGYRTPWAQLDAITRGMHGGELWVLIAAKKTGKCVDKDTLIVDPDTGLVRTIEDAYKFGGNVHTLSSDGRLVTAAPTWIDTGTKECLTITLRSGRSIVCTPEHPLLTSAGWVRADSLSTGDHIASAKRMPRPRQTRKMDMNEADALAYMLAEGCSSGHTPNFSNGDREIVRHATRVFESLGCRVEKAKNSDYDWYIYSRTRPRGHEKAPMRKLLEKYGVFGLRSTEKIIPNSVFSLPDDQLARFIGIIWSCDGTIERSQGDISIGLASKKMVEQLSWLLMRFGIVGRIRERTNNGFKNWEYRVRSECYASFKANIQMIGRKRRILANHPGTQKPTQDVVISTAKIVDTITRYVDEVKGAKDALRAEFGGRSNLYLVTNKRRISRDRLRKVAAAMIVSGESRAASDLSLLISDDIFWDEIVSIKDAGVRKVYDASVADTHCFVANFIVAHNTWGEILFLRELVRQGARPLLVTMEMSSDKIIRRFDAMYSTLAFGDFRSGLLGFDGIQRYIDEMKRMATEGEFFIAGDGLVRCPADIEILVQDLNPGIILIDGVYLMEPSGRKWGSKYEKVSTVIDELQPMAHRIKLPVMMTTQFNRSLKEGSLVGDSGKVGYAYEIVQNCLPGDSLISTDDGITRLDSVVGKAGLRVWNGLRSVPARVMMTGKKRVYEVHLDNGQVVRASKDHRFLVLENGHTSWAAVEDICPGDAVCRAKPLMREPDGAPSRVDERRVHGRDIKLPFEIDDSIALILGILTGDGWVAHEWQWSLSGHVDDSDVIAEFDRLLLRTFGVKFSAIRHHRKTLTAVLACRELARHAHSVYGLTKGIAHQKEVPSGVLSGTPAVWMAFLRGLFETDGCVDPKAGHVMLTSVSPNLVRQSTQLLQSLGIDCSMFPIKVSRFGRHQPYRVLIANSGIAAFADKIGFIGRRKQLLLRDALQRPRRKKWAIPRSSVIATVTEVRPSEKIEPMYDVLTNSKEHAFWVDGLLAHNCDVCLAMYRDKDLRASNRMLWSIMEHREGEDYSWLTRWDLEEMNFDFVQEVQLEELMEDQKKGKSSASTFKF